MLKMIKLSFDDINNEQIACRTIAQSFNQCGVNPFAEKYELEAFKRHLDSLSTLKAYDLLLDSNKELSVKAECYD